MLGLSNTTVFTQLPLTEQLGLAMTHVFEELDQHTSMPEFGKALRELPAGVDIEVFAEFLFAQWRIVNHAHQVETQRFVQVGPRKPEPIATAQSRCVPCRKQAGMPAGIRAPFSNRA